MSIHFLKGRSANKVLSGFADRVSQVAFFRSGNQIIPSVPRAGASSIKLKMIFL